METNYDEVRNDSSLVFKEGGKANFVDKLEKAFLHTYILPLTGTKEAGMTSSIILSERNSFLGSLTMEYTTRVWKILLGVLRTETLRCWYHTKVGGTHKLHFATIGFFECAADS